MRKIMILLLIFGMKGVAAQKINYHSSLSTYAEIVQEAERLQKPIFITVYTKDDADREGDLFPVSQELADSFFNVSFLNIKAKAEKGYGANLSKKHVISSYPAFLFFSPSGELLHKISGYHPEEAVVFGGKCARKMMEIGIDKGKMEGLLHKKDLCVKEFREILEYQQTLGLPTAGIVEEYLAGLSEDSLYHPEVVHMVLWNYKGNIRSDSRVCQVLLQAYKNDPIKTIHQMKPWTVLRRQLHNSVMAAGINKDKAWLEDLLQVVAMADTTPWVAEREMRYYTCLYYAFSGEKESFKQEMLEFADRYVMNLPVDNFHGINEDRCKEDFKKYTELGGSKISEQEKDYSHFSKRYYCHIQIVSEEINRLVAEYISDYGISSDELEYFKTWLNKGLALCKESKVEIHDRIVRSLESKIDFLMVYNQ